MAGGGVPVRAGQAGHGQDGPARRDGGGGQVDANLGVVADCLFGLSQAVAGGLQARGVQFAGPAGGFLGGPLAGISHDPGQAARGGHLPAHAVPAGLLDLGVDQVAVLAANVGGGRGDGSFRGGLFGGEQFEVGFHVPAVEADPTAGQVGDLVDPVEQFAVVADDDHDPGPGGDGVVEPSAGVQVEVVGRLVEQQDVRAAQEQRGQRD